MKRFFIFIATVLALLGCSDDPDDNPGGKADNDVIKISAYLADIKPANARTAINGSTASWANNDVLGLFCSQAKLSASNVSFTVTGLPTTPLWTSNPAIFWADGTTAHTFLAYAPYASGNSSSGTVKLPALTPQTGTINPAQDFLASNNLGTTGVTRTASSGLVGLTFTHVFALIELDITINASIVAGTTLQSCTFTGITGDKPFSSDNNSTIDLSSKAIAVSGTTVNTLTVNPAPAPSLSTTATKIFIIVLPGSWTPAFTFTVNEGSGNDITIPTASITATNYQAGQKYIYAVSISRTAINISTPTITDWTSNSSGNINGGI